MKELLATNNLVTISYVEALLTEAGIDYLILDQNMSVLEGSIGIIPRRVMVESNKHLAATQLIQDANLEKELTTARK